MRKPGQIKKGEPNLITFFILFQNLKQLNSITLENFYQVLPEF